MPVRSETEARGILEDLKKQYHDARHHCFAWRIGTAPPEVRASDDGEPSNSAGKPILNQIESHDLTNVVIVVVRYFGGTLLGVGGLVNAYKSAAEIAISNNRIITSYIRHSYELHFPYKQMNDVMTIIKENSLHTFDQNFDNRCILKFEVKLTDEKRIKGLLGKIPDCRLKRIDDT
ncbi:MAG: YigZ family protein [Bacteroidales bacterium]|nr:YigZ family protein [Bacteroidales bacterium]